MTELEEARKIFGPKVAHLTDSELEALLKNMQYLLDTWIQDFKTMKQNTA